jgi:Ca2+/H+ antiporter, TMEM165/GDT1 family
MYASHPRRKKWLFLLVPVVAAAALFGFTFIVMTLWNAVIPAITGFKIISFWQAMGLLVLSKILFGGLRMGGGWKGGRGGARWREKWATMTPEEKDRFKSEWRRRCGRE